MRRGARHAHARDEEQAAAGGHQIKEGPGMNDDGNGSSGRTRPPQPVPPGAMGQVSGPWACAEARSLGAFRPAPWGDRA
jgi:hypothetical protein